MTAWPFLFKQNPIEGIDLFHPEVLIPQWNETYAALPIGKIMEHRFRDALLASRRYELVSHGLQIQGEDRTLGELDFLIRDLEDRQVWHIEFVYKFYIYRQELGSDRYDPWIGPGLKDRLIYKLDKLTRQQFPILHSTECRTLLEPLGLDVDRIKQGLAFCAELFLPLGIDEIPEGLDTRCIQGRWYDEGHEPESYSILDRKSDWIRPLSNLSNHGRTKSIEESLLERGHVMIREESGQKSFILRNQYRVNT